MQKQQVRKITLGQRKRGISVTDLDGHEWRLKFDDNFAVIPDSAVSVLLLHGKKRFRLVNADEQIFIEIYGRKFLFSPFLRIDWLRKMLHYQGD